MDRRKYMTSDEVRQLRTVTEAEAITDLAHGRTRGPRAWMLVDLALATGLRIGEIARITVADIDLKREYILVRRSKTKHPKPTPLAIPTGLVTHLRDYLAWRQLVAPAEPANLLVGKRGAYTPEGLADVWAKAVARAGLPKYTAHAARHTLATRLLAKTKNLRLVQRQLGHQSLSSTAIYADVSDEDMKAGVEGLYD